jgi:hypothetical protein
VCCRHNGEDVGVDCSYDARDGLEDCNGLSIAMVVAQEIKRRRMMETMALLNGRGNTIDSAGTH